MEKEKTSLICSNLHHSRNTILMYCLIQSLNFFRCDLIWYIFLQNENNYNYLKKTYFHQSNLTIINFEYFMKKLILPLHHFLPILMMN